MYWLSPLLVVLILLFWFFSIIVTYDSELAKYPNTSHIAQIATIFGNFIVLEPSSSLITFLGITSIILKLISIFLAFAIFFAFYKLITEKSLGKSILYLFLYTFMISFISFLTFIISFQIDRPKDMGGLIGIVLPIAFLVLFGTINFLIVLFTKIITKKNSI